MRVAFHSVTRDDIKKTLYYKSISNVIGEKLISFDQFNKEGLSKRYNDILDKCIDKYEYIIFVHDDVYIDDARVIEKLDEAHKEFDIVGLAGGLHPKIQTPALWHLMCGGFHGGNLRGAVAHYADDTKLFMTNFGVTPCRVTILDGLFLSIKTEAVKKTGWRFNENYTFHHYDIASCLDANKKKMKLGVAPIWVIHKSPGLLNPNDNMFLESQEKFIREYSNL
jgi:hypothetical protein